MKQCGDHLEAIRKTSEEIVAAASKAFEDGVVPVVTNVMEWCSMQGVIQAGEAPDDAIVSQYLFAVDALNDAIVAAHSPAPTAGGGGAGSITITSSMNSARMYVAGADKSTFVHSISTGELVGMLTADWPQGSSSSSITVETISW